MRLICSYTFLLVLFLRPWNVHGSFPGTWLPSSFSQLHDHRTQLCSVAVQEAVLVHHPVFELFILSAACAALQCNSAGSVLPAHLLALTLPQSLPMSFLSATACLSSHSVTGHPWKELFSDTAVTLSKIPWVKTLCQLLIIGMSFDLLIAVFFKALLNYYTLFSNYVYFGILNNT